MVVFNVKKYFETEVYLKHLLYIIKKTHLL